MEPAAEADGLALRIGAPLIGVPSRRIRAVLAILARPRPACAIVPSPPFFRRAFSYSAQPDVVVPLTAREFNLALLLLFALVPQPFAHVV